MESEVLALYMFAAVLVGIFTGFPIAFVIGAIGLFFGYIGFGDAVFSQVISRLFWVMNNEAFPAIPLFIFMGAILERSGVIARLFSDLRLAMGPLRGSLALATMFVCTVFAAATGIVGASVTMMGMIALPAMLKYNYNKELATGTILAGGTLGILIPPSIMLLVYAPMAQLSIAKMFGAAIIPGLLLAGLFTIYIFLRCLFQSGSGPAIPKEERTASPLQLSRRLLISLLPTVLLVVLVLGSILAGLAAPTEAAAVGALGGIIISMAYRSLTWKNFKETVYTTLKVSSMILIIAVGASIFTGVFLRLGGGRLFREILTGLPVPPLAIAVMVLFFVFIMGMFLDWVGILLIFVPIIHPILPSLGFDPLWFAIIVCVTLQTSFLSPPYAVSIFYLKGVAPPEINLGHIYRGVIPFLVLQLVGVGLCITFPQIVLWLPSLLYQ